MPCVGGEGPQGFVVGRTARTGVTGAAVALTLGKLTQGCTITH